MVQSPHFLSSVTRLTNCTLSIPLHLFVSSVKPAAIQSARVLFRNARAAHKSADHCSIPASLFLRSQSFLRFLRIPFLFLLNLRSHTFHIESTERLYASINGCGETRPVYGRENASAAPKPAPKAAVGTLLPSLQFSKKNPFSLSLTHCVKTLSRFDHPIPHL